jgi:hypothetical protein
LVPKENTLEYMPAFTKIWNALEEEAIMDQAHGDFVREDTHLWITEWIGDFIISKLYIPETVKGQPPAAEQRRRERAPGVARRERGEKASRGRDDGDQSEIAAKAGASNQKSGIYGDREQKWWDRPRPEIDNPGSWRGSKMGSNGGSRPRRPGTDVGRKQTEGRRERVKSAGTGIKSSGTATLASKWY